MIIYRKVKHTKHGNERFLLIIFRFSCYGILFAWILVCIFFCLDPSQYLFLPGSQLPSIFFIAWILVSIFFLPGSQLVSFIAWILVSIFFWPGSQLVSFLPGSCKEFFPILDPDPCQHDTGLRLCLQSLHIGNIFLIGNIRRNYYNQFFLTRLRCLV